MKFSLVLAITAAICLGLFRFARFTQRTESSLKQYTLAEVYAEFLHEIETMAKLRMRLFIPVGVVGLFSCFFPIALLVSIRISGPAMLHHSRILLFLAGLLAAAGAAVNVFMMLLSQVSFTFGGGKRKKETIFFLIIAVFQSAFALASIAVAIWQTFGDLLYRLIV